MTEIENDLRTWMQERAARVHASPEILETDYRPRARRPAAEAGDRRRPRRTRRHRHRGAVTRRWREHGVRRLDRAADDGQPQRNCRRPELLQREHPRSQPSTQQAVDSRGPYTIIVYAGPAGSTQTYNFCTVGPGLQQRLRLDQLSAGDAY